MSKKYSKLFAINRGENLLPVNEKTYNSSNAITLIALIITIITLLILAGISLSLVVGENGIVSRAIKARKIQGISGAKEQLELEIASLSNEFYQAKFVNSEISGDVTVGDYILKNLENGTFANNYTLSKNETTGEVIIENKSASDSAVVTCTIDSNGKISWSEINTEPWIQDKTKVTNGKVTLEVGSKVSEYETNGISDWYVLGAKGGKLLITTNVNVGTVQLSGREGYTKGIAELNKIAENYTNSTYADGKARTIDVDDINRVTGYDPETANFGTGQIYEYGNEVTYYWKGDEYPYYSGNNNKTGNLYNSHNIFYYLDASELSGWARLAKSTTATTDNKEKISTLTSNFYYYYPKTLTTSSSGTTNGISITSPAYTLLFKQGNSKTTYWLGSSYVDCGLDSAYFGLRRVDNGSVNSGGIAGSNGYVTGPSSGVRPVVSLKSEVNVTSSGVLSINQN